MIGVIIGLGFFLSPAIVQAPPMSYEVNELMIIQGNSLVAIFNSSLPLKTSTQTSLNGKSDILYLFEGKDPKLRTICFCESSFNPLACSYKGCYSGMGLCGFIPNTWNLTLERMKKAGIEFPVRCDVPIISVEGFETDKSHPVFDAECNVILADWLYQRDGDSHWNSSKICWSE